MAQQNIRKLNMVCHHSNYLGKVLESCCQVPGAGMGMDKNVYYIVTLLKTASAEKGQFLLCELGLEDLRHIKAFQLSTEGNFIQMEKYIPHPEKSWYPLLDSSCLRCAHLNISLWDRKKHRRGNGLRPSEPPKEASYINRS